MTSHEQRYRLGPVTVSGIGFGAMQLPAPGYSGRRRTAAGRTRRWPGLRPEGLIHRSGQDAAAGSRVVDM
jgi:hypothetical protein